MTMSTLSTQCVYLAITVKNSAYRNSANRS